jgi:peptidoglycan/xylan/chitin deacetylase (PgdA/CDA1 family)
VQPAESPRLFRPPYGTVSVASTVVPWLHRETVVLWSVDYKDFKAEDPGEITERVASTPLTPGDIILYHGHSPAALAALPAVLQAGQRDGLTFVPVSRMCQR